MRSAIRLLLPATMAALLGLAACAPAPGPEQRPCPADWSAAGEADARAGRPAERGLAQLGACLAGTSAPALEEAEDAYLAAHDRGRAVWCSPANARALGRRGAPKTLECPPPLRSAFDQAYAEGRAEAERAPPASPWPRVRPILSL
ncbi:MAG: DUF2799 domain-containing protein, partial [Pseudomonadota bacterium]